MQRVYIWTLCLTIGITGNSCLVSHTLRYEFVFINETDHTIELYIWPHMIDGVWFSSLERRAVKILPNSKSRVFAIPSPSGPEVNPALPQGVLQMLLHGPLIEDMVSILVDDTECFLFRDSGFALASNYKSEVFERDRRVRHTYTFTNADFEVAKPCEEE